MATDTSGNQAVDFVWGNFPMQPNDDRAATVSNTGGSTGDYGWAATTLVASGRLDPALDNHVIAEAGWSGYPGYTPSAGNFIVTAASGNGTTITYTSQNFLEVGDVVNITGLNNSAFNLTGATVASVKAASFTVTSAAGSGVTITGQYGKVESATAATDADGVGIGNIIVPAVVGLTTAVALDKLKDAGYETANITTATAATNTKKNVTRFNATSATVAVVYTSSASTAYPVGSKVTLATGVAAGEAPVNLPAYAKGTWTVTAADSSTITIAGSGFTVADTTGINETANIFGVAGTIKTQSTAANAANISTNATITITPYAAAS